MQDKNKMWPDHFLTELSQQMNFGEVQAVFGVTLYVKSKDSERYLPAAFFLSMPFPTQFSAAVTTVGSEKPSTLFTVFSIHGFSSSSSLLDSAILWEKEDSLNGIQYDGT